jgi:hypothetical protein
MYRPKEKEREREREKEREREREKERKRERERERKREREVTATHAAWVCCCSDRSLILNCAHNKRSNNEQIASARIEHPAGKLQNKNKHYRRQFNFKVCGNSLYRTLKPRGIIPTGESRFNQSSAAPLSNSTTIASAIVCKQIAIGPNDTVCCPRSFRLFHEHCTKKRV